MPLFAQQRCARFYPVVYHIIPKKTSRPGGGGLQIQEILMVGLKEALNKSTRADSERFFVR